MLDRVHFKILRGPLYMHIWIGERATIMGLKVMLMGTLDDVDIKDVSLYSVGDNDEAVDRHADDAFIADLGYTPERSTYDNPSVLRLVVAEHPVEPVAQGKTSFYISE